ncbi:MAG: LytTR family DNA-binding domain-containing protein [Bacteroidota bacterium]
MLSCITIEDYPPAQFILQKYIGDTESLSLAETFSDAIEAQAYLAQHSIDLIFLDINLPKLSGIDFLKKEKYHPFIILTTAYSEYALESYKFNVVDYLLKPFSFERFSQAINKVHSFTSKRDQLSISQESSSSETLYIKSGYDIVIVKSQDVFFIKSDADYTELITDSKKLVSSDSLKVWLTKLGEDFCQIHKSYIINLKHLKKISQNKIHMAKEHILPIGRTYKKDFMEKYVKP